MCPTAIAAYFVSSLLGDSVLRTIFFFILLMINVRVSNLYAYINVPFVPGGINSLGRVA